jgi:hypothetical protein
MVYELDIFNEEADHLAAKLQIDGFQTCIRA